LKGLECIAALYQSYEQGHIGGCTPGAEHLGNVCELLIEVTTTVPNVWWRSVLAGGWVDTAQSWDEQVSKCITYTVSTTVSSVSFSLVTKRKALGAERVAERILFCLQGLPEKATHVYLCKMEGHSALSCTASACHKFSDGLIRADRVAFALVVPC
jgi:hypothetical protein